MQPNSQFLEQEEKIDFSDIFKEYYRYWYWFLLSIVFLLFTAFVFLRFSIPSYESKASVLVRDEDKGANISELNIFKEIMGVVGGASGNVQNEIEIFKSRTLLSNVAKNLRLNFTLHQIGDRSRIVRSEIYKDAPIIVQLLQSDSTYFNANTSLRIEFVNKYQFTLYEEGRFLGRFNFGVPFRTSAGNLTLHPTDQYLNYWYDKTIMLNIVPLNEVVTALQENLKIEVVNKEATVLSLSLKGSNIKKNNDILNTLINLHKQDAIEDKNEVARNTSKFINERMKFIIEELSSIEKDGQDYKSRYKLIDVATDASVYLQKETQTDKAITETNIQLSLSDYLYDYILKQNGFDDLLPANLGFKDQSVGLMIGQYNQLVLDRKKLLQNTSDKSPSIQKIETQLIGLKKSLKESLKNLKSMLQLELNKLNDQEKLIQSKISSVPKYEREYRNIMRQQQIKETLYLFLLQKREENEITLAASIANTKVVDYAYSNEEITFPKPNIIYLAALLIGLFIPAGFIYVRDFFNNKVHGRKEIEQYQLPFLGEIPQNKSKNDLVVGHGLRTPIAEAFRILRTNINFMLDMNKSSGKVIFVTSTVASEGKSFISLNLAHTFALTGTKTVLVGMDLRAPRQLSNYQFISTKGVTNYITDNKLDLDDILQPIPDAENLYFIPSGTLPPNPAELLMRQRMDDLFIKLRSTFDYIIVDTAPAGLVTDTLLVASKSDSVVYVVRANMLDHRMLSIPQRFYSEQKLPNMAIVLNAVDFNKRGSGYGYGYGYGYGEVSKKSTFVKRMFGRKST
jgi:tyrosine-protein kinase Etk/Wzc